MDKQDRKELDQLTPARFMGQLWSTGWARRVSFGSHAHLSYVVVVRRRVVPYLDETKERLMVVNVRCYRPLYSRTKTAKIKQDKGMGWNAKRTELSAE
jgi:hypothetical protein